MGSELAWGVAPVFPSSPKPTSLNPTAIMPAFTASAMASVGLFKCGPVLFGRHVAMNRESEPALSGFPVVRSLTIATVAVDRRELLITDLYQVEPGGGR